MKAKHIIAALLGAGFVALVFFAPGGEGGHGRMEEGAPAPGFELTDTGGRHWRLSELRGSVVVINFWATWCPPCREETPSLNRLYERRAGEPGLVILTVLYRDDPREAAAYIEKNGFGFPVLLDPEGAVAEAYGLTGVPETFVIDREGVLRKKIIGPFEFDSPYAARLFEGIPG